MPTHTQARLGPANVLNLDEVHAVLDACSRKTRARRAPTGERNYALVMAMWRAGLRVNEALSLHRGDLRLRDTPAAIRVLHGKGNRFRVVGAHSDLVAALEDWLAVAPRSPYVFCTLAGGRLSDGYVRTMLRRKGQRAGVARVHPHAFRATLAVELARELVPMPVIRDVLGHTSIATTDAYLRRVDPRLAIEAVANRDVLAAR